MSDARFFRAAGPFPLSYIADRIGADAPTPEAGNVLIHDIDTLETAERGHLSLFCDARYRDAVAETKASVIVTSHELARHIPDGKNLLFAAEPRLAFARAGHLLYPAAPLEPGIDASARIHPGATIGVGSQIDAGAVIGRDARIGKRCHIGSHAVLGTGVVVGDDCRIGAHTAISNALIGARVAIATSASIGGQGFGFVPEPRGLLRMLQLGRVIIADDVEIGANCAIDRGATGDTVIGAGTMIDNLVQIGHNVRLGRHCVLSGQVGIAGSTVLGDGVMVGGQTAISDHLTIGSGARIAGKSGVMRDIEAGGKVGGYPAMPLRQWHRQTAGLLSMFGRKSAKSCAAKSPADDR
ncbi:MAG TPA: UDP-3-O-(3-hydroxymyristoyl)glucosamine N-acyltransferase [Stellaceae bacterium]|nr:UDP-3-O-(3-hydroxymyristoyl)glucosamine N-acyltransferase [Stellaceae bacterium]